MRIKKLQLKNGYKRFHDLTIDLGESPKRIVALIGPNGCGKSSVLDGMLYRNNSFEIVGAKQKKGPQYHSMNQLPNFDSENINIQFDIAGTFYQIREARKVNRLQNTIFSFRSPYRYNSNLKVDETRTTADIKLNTYGATVSSDLDDKMEENYRRLYVKFNKYLNDTDCRPSEAKEKIVGDLNASIENCLDLKIDNIGNIESGQGTLYFKKADHPKPFEFNVLSSGEKEVVDILLDLYLRQDEYNDTVFLIDEPELHVNTSIQKKLLLEINKLVGKNCQIWIATHSIGFLRALQSELKEECQVIQFKKGVKWASEPQVIKPMKNTRANWLEIFETALDDLTGLISPKRIVYCEGKHNPGTGGLEKGMDATVFNNIFNEKYHDTLFVSSGGNTELDQRSGIALAILTKVFSDIEILVFKDRDVSSGRTNTLADRQVYLDNNPANHRMMKRWEIENYLFDKEVLICYCDSIGHKFNEAEYDKIVTDIDNQDVKGLVNHIRNFCGITSSINPDKFKITLSGHVKEDMNVYKELEGCIF
ncbi:AAA family ATPase [Pedobacter africanus]|uniref:AAA domain-containing protein, putative AbiEii toxin, Type IV TA system n=1 Tax=Pedobacter africanus TaxID=151894 RepID=A0A1W1Z6J6_9SPHI|nr:ATP-binding protein [Pedobacter africanus]SMC44043.1 AAA domain-containing protein, putative AbiEii toxin, Type IV TA system [Pedobacter africanus]